MASVINKVNCGTGTSNKEYDLVSILYHCLEGAATYEQYIEDAKEAGDKELADFFAEVKQTNCQLSEKAKNLLKQRLNQ